jgi:uncharacterized caspase-like protein
MPTRNVLLALYCVTVFQIVTFSLYQPAKAENLLALVIGNSNYRHATNLINPPRDATAIAANLKKVGFTVTTALNQDNAAMRRTLQKFARAASTADVVAIYYAGHGIEVENQNFLIPVDAKLTAAEDIEYETVPLRLLMKSVIGAKRLSIIILDACRANPFATRMLRRGATRSIGRGLARVEPGNEMLIAYAAKAGSVAEDGGRDRDAL